MSALANRATELRAEALRREKARRDAQKSLLGFSRYTDSRYQAGWHHRVLCGKLDQMVSGKIKRLMVFMPPRHGKAIAHTTPVPTPNGWVAHGDLRVGDTVFHPSGKRIKVVALSQDVMADCAVTTRFGERIVCHEAHEWGVHDRSYGKYRVIETKELLRVRCVSGATKPRSRFMLPDVEAIDGGPCALERKRVHAIPVRRRDSIVNAERCEPQAARCIQVDSPDGLYVVGRTPTATHNSELVSRKFPAYILGKNPDANVIAASYSQDLVASMNRSVQRVIDSERYARVFPETKLNGRNVVTTQSWLRNSEEFEIVNKRGYYKCAGVGGGITGRGFDFGIIDDPIKGAEDASSPTMREKVWEWYTSVFLTRQQRDARILLTLTRWHEDDLAGRILANDPDGWHIIRFPAIREDDDNPEDPREIGEALWPEWYPVATLDKLRLDAGSRVWSSLYQQRPAPDDGGEFQRQWFRYAGYDQRSRITFPDGRAYALAECYRYGTMDVAGTVKTTSDYTAYGFWALTPCKRLVLLDRVRARFETPKILPLIQSSTTRFGLATTHIETNGIGLPIFQGAQAARARVSELKQHKDKIARARFAQPWFERGDVWFMADAGYLSELESELLTFPNATHDDQVDMVTMGVQVADGFVYGGVGGLLTGQVSGERRPANRLLEPPERHVRKPERHTEMAKPWRQL